MKEEFIKHIEDNKGIILKVCGLYCRTRQDKEDLFQDIILQLWRSYPSFKGESKFSTWMYRIALNTAITRLRKETRNEATIINIIEINLAEPDPQNNEELEILYDAIKQLNDIEKAILTLYIDDYSYHEIAEIMGLSESNVGFKLNKIKSKLKILVKSQ